MNNYMYKRPYKRPYPDPRLLDWAIPETCKPERRVCLAYSTNKDVRLTYLAQAWREPCSFTTRYATLLAGLSAQERRARLLARVAEAIAHPAIPEEERHHLYVTIHTATGKAAINVRATSACRLPGSVTRRRGDGHACSPGPPSTLTVHMKHNTRPTTTPQCTAAVFNTVY